MNRRPDIIGLSRATLKTIRGLLGIAAAMAFTSLFMAAAAPPDDPLSQPPPFSPSVFYQMHAAQGCPSPHLSPRIFPILYGSSTLDILDKDGDENDDSTGQPARIISMTAGIVVSVSSLKQPAGTSALWLFDPGIGRLTGYAPIRNVDVKAAECVSGGRLLGLLARLGTSTSLHVRIMESHGNRWKSVSSSVVMTESVPWPLDQPPIRGPQYPWLLVQGSLTTLASLPVPSGWQRTPVATGTFEEWLRSLPVTRRDNGWIVDIGSPSKIIEDRLRAEYLLSRGQTHMISVLTGNTRCYFTEWLAEPSHQGSRAVQLRQATPRALRQFLAMMAAVDPKSSSSDNRTLIVDRAVKQNPPERSVVEMVLRIRWNPAKRQIEVMPWSSPESMPLTH